ncbi:diguanylate cyclase [Denitromonas sp.]|uniref:diguanylate cyclase n=1 Tax=Denitromonas sp. TaxID=2734609 RepID=UPI003A8AB391
MIESQWVRQPVLAMVYAVAGVVASLLPGPVPGELAIALPAAVALLAWLACGRWAVIGIGIGALVFGMISDPLLLSMPRQQAVVGAIVMAVAAVAQAGVGAVLTRRYVPGWRQLTHVLDALRLFVFAGALPAVLWALARLGVRSFSTIGAIEQPGEVFLAGWLSQLVAVIAVMPVLLTLWWWRVPLWRARLSTLAVPAGAVLLAVLGLFRIAADVEQERHAARFEALASAISHRFEDRVSAMMVAVDATDRFLESTLAPSRRAFRHQTEILLARAPGLAALQWVPQVQAQERAAYEARARADGIDGFAFREFDGGGQLVPARLRDIHYPVFFSVPRQASPFRLGVDLAASDEWMRTIERVLDSGLRSVSAVSFLAAPPDQAQADPAVLVVSPIYRGAPDAAESSLGGLTVGVLRVAPMMASVVAEFDLAGLRLSLVDITDGEARLYPAHDVPVGDGMAMSETVSVGDRMWQLRLVEDPLFTLAGGVPLMWIALVGSAVFFALLHGFLLTVSGQRVEVARLIGDGTAQLRREVEERRRVEATLRQSEARMSGVFQAVLDGIVIIDEHGTIDSVNPAVASIFGWSPEALVGQNVSMLMPEPFRSHHDGYLADFRRTGHRHTIGFNRTVEGLRKNGSRFPVELTVSELPLTQRTLFVGVMRDISERVASAEQSRQFNEQLQDMVSALERRDAELTELNRINEQLMACKDRAEAAEVVRMAMRRIFPGSSGRILAYAPGVRDGLLTEWVSWGDASGIATRCHGGDCWAVRQGRSYEVVASEALVRCAHVAPEVGPYICLPLMVQGQAQAVLTLACGSSTERQRRNLEHLLTAVSESANLALSNLNLREILHEQVLRDPLTQLYNRRYMEVTLDSEVKRARRNGSRLGCAVIDLDHFKAINDAYGHDVGDEVLRRIADLLQRWFRSTDTVCRYGGEEFVVVLPEQAADAIAERLTALQAHFADEIFHAGSRRFARCTFSAGVAVEAGDAIDATALLKQADTALYQAKAAGRNCVILAGH